MKILCVALFSILISCKDSVETMRVSKKWTNKYELFDEPSPATIMTMDSYMLFVSYHLMDTLDIISIRNRNKFVQVFHKKVPYDQIPPMFNNVPDLKSFRFETFRNVPKFVELKSVLENLELQKILNLKDSAITNGTDGSVKELVYFDGQNLHNFYRGYVNSKAVEPEFLRAFEIVRKLTIAHQD